VDLALGSRLAYEWSRTAAILRVSSIANRDLKKLLFSLARWLQGNDGIYELQEGRPIEEIIADAINNTRVFLDPLFEEHPDIQVVQFGYDIVNFGMSASCRNLGEDLFPWCNGNTTCMNSEMYKLQYDYVEQLSTYYGGRHVALNLLGTMQASRPNEVPGPYPNAAYFSPEDLMSDCIHPTNEGFEIIFDRMFEEYWREQLDSKKHVRA